MLGAAFQRSSVVDAVTHVRPQGAHIALPPLYVALSPISRVLDTIGLLSVDQHIAVGVTVIVLGALIGFLRGRKRVDASARSAVRSAIGTSVMTLIFTVAIYACSVALPRPMAKLSVADPDVMLVDFHSHTNASSDARKGFSPEENRAWHERGGFDAAYVSDHRTFAGAITALSENPTVDASGTVLLSAYEGRYLGTFEIFLGLTRADSTTLLDTSKHLRDGVLRTGELPTSVVALPAPLRDVQAVARDNPPHIVAIEINDGSPRGFAQTDREGNRIIRRADSLGIALVSGSNNHGWGHVVPAWTLVRVRGWRSIAPDSLGSAIQSALRNSPRAVSVAERRRPTLSTPLAASLTVPVALGQMLATLTILERFSWLVWIWLAWLLVFAFRYRYRWR